MSHTLFIIILEEFLMSHTLFIIILGESDVTYAVYNHPRII